MQLHQQKGMISLSPPTICNSAADFNSSIVTQSSSQQEQKSDEETKKNAMKLIN
ncbi:hypothetical protein ECEC1865_6056 [Escherichia coli EC1865]|nr:hypothetical protein ECEC1865_6056 [Escherichia coli EC1865]